MVQCNDLVCFDVWVKFVLVNIVTVPLLFLITVWLMNKREETTI